MADTEYYEPNPEELSERCKRLAEEFRRRGLTDLAGLLLAKISYWDYLALEVWEPNSVRRRAWWLLDELERGKLDALQEDR